MRRERKETRSRPPASVVRRLGGLSRGNGVKCANPLTGEIGILVAHEKSFDGRFPGVSHLGNVFPAQSIGGSQYPGPKRC